LLRESSKLVGLRNYFELINDKEFFRALVNTVVWAFSSSILQALIGLGLAILMNQEFKGKTLSRVLVLLPWTTPIIVCAVLWSWLLAEPFGIINYLAVNLGVINKPVAWLASDTYSLWITSLVWTWISIPIFFMVVLAALQSVPPQLYDAAKVDGAGPLAIFKSVTFPHVLPVFGVMFTLRMIASFNHFSTIFFLTGGGPGGATETLPLFIYKTFWLEYDAGSAAAASVLNMIMMYVVWSLYSSIRRRLFG
jgi:multiple sugar transport system permease protein